MVGLLLARRLGGEAAYLFDQFSDSVNLLLTLDPTTPSIPYFIRCNALFFYLILTSRCVNQTDVDLNLQSFELKNEFSMPQIAMLGFSSQIAHPGTRIPSSSRFTPAPYFCYLVLSTAIRVMKSQGS